MRGSGGGEPSRRRSEESEAGPGVHVRACVCERECVRAVGLAEPQIKLAPRRL